MKKMCLPILAVIWPVFAQGASDYPITPVPFTAVHFTAGLWQERQATNTAVTLPFAMNQLDASKRMQNFDLAAETMRRRTAGETNFQNRPVTQFPFDDSDAYKVIEGASFCLSVKPDPAIEARVENFIKEIAAAQEPDGYLYTWRTMHPDSPAHGWIGQQRWVKDPELSHELYDAGHLYEAGTAWFQATGSRDLLDICLKNAELVNHDLGTNGHPVAPGHEVIEMGLAKLYRQTGDPRWLELAQTFLEARGHGGNQYNQNQIPVLDQTEAVGHAVRANYLYSGMADVAALTGDQRYVAAIERIWENVVGCKLYLTGGCGALASGEAYGKNYQLPNNAYNETCAAVAFLFWNERMFLLTGDAKYMDVFERTLYNGFLSGVSLSGDRFFYPNPLECDGKSRFNQGYPGRAPWFGCACCPPNLMRMRASLGGYVCAIRNDEVFVNLYASSETKLSVSNTPVTLVQTTDYPWYGEIHLAVNPATPTKFTLSLRIPEWTRGQPLPSDLYYYANAAPTGWHVRVNGIEVKVDLHDGYARLQRTWKPGDQVLLSLSMPVRRVLGNSKIAATEGKVALERGPVVYCLEGVDNNDHVFNAVLGGPETIEAVYHPELLGGVTVLDIENAEHLASDGKELQKNVRLTAIPYYAWNNRGTSSMTVWLERGPAPAGKNPGAM
jgi:DUF1680 family protein